MENTSLLSEEKIVNRIYLVRGKKVMLDKDLAEMYGVVTGRLNQAVKRNSRRFPDDFMFQLTPDELKSLMSQFVMSSATVLESQFVIPMAKSKRGGAWSLPYVFTEQGVAMLSSVLSSDTAIDVNIQIIRVFTRMREVLLTQKDMLLKLEALEKKMGEQGVAVGKHEEEIVFIFEALKQLTAAPPVEAVPMEKVGYKRKE
jgi:hypothetical protein